MRTNTPLQHLHVQRAASVRVALAASLRVCETAGDKWLTEIGPLICEVF